MRYREIKIRRSSTRSRIEKRDDELLNLGS